MLKETDLREAAFGWIVELRPGTIFYSDEIYHFLEENFPTECKKRGDTSNEPRCRNDARWAVRDAKDKKIVESTNQRAPSTERFKKLKMTQYRKLVPAGIDLTGLRKPLPYGTAGSGRSCAVDHCVNG
jgi:hypothetical protein